MRLFTALVPPEAAVRSLAGALRDVPAAPGVRWIAAEQWHVTLGFFGDDDPASRDVWLRPRLAGMMAPRIHLAGAGTFRGVLWCGVAGDELGTLAEAAGADNTERAFHPHVTLARGHPPGGLGNLVSYLADHAGPSWLATQVVLMRSDRGHTGATYTPVARYPLEAG